MRHETDPLAFGYVYTDERTHTEVLKRHLVSTEWHPTFHGMMQVPTTAIGALALELDVERQWHHDVYFYTGPDADHWRFVGGATVPVRRLHYNVACAVALGHYHSIAEGYQAFIRNQSGEK